MPMSLTQTLKYLLVASFVSFLVQQTGDQFFGTHLLSIFGLTPNGFFSNHHYWQIFTYAFIHTDVVQLVFNLMILALVGSELERTWGRTQFLAYYFFCTAATGLIYLAASFAFVGGVAPLDWRVWCPLWLVHRVWFDFWGARAPFYDAFSNEGETLHLDPCGPSVDDCDLYSGWGGRWFDSLKRHGDRVFVPFDEDEVGLDPEAAVKGVRLRSSFEH